MIELCRGYIITTSKWYLLIKSLGHRTELHPLKLLHVMHILCLLYDLFGITFSKCGVVGLRDSRSQIGHQVQLGQTCPASSVLAALPLESASSQLGRNWLFSQILFLTHLFFSLNSCQQAGRGEKKS